MKQLLSLITLLFIVSLTFNSCETKKEEPKRPNILFAIADDNFHNLYPQYKFNKHKGYPTKEHYDAIKKYGTCPIHRLSYKGVTNY